MFKRMRWMVMGASMGATGSVYVKHRLKRFLRAHTPPEVAHRAAQQARTELRAAVTEGKEAMRQREAELRAEVHRRTRSS